MPKPQLTLKHFTFADLFIPIRLQQLDEAFLTYLSAYSSTLAMQLIAYREETQVFSKVQISELLITCARVLEDFTAELFGIEHAAANLQSATLQHKPVFAFKEWFVLRQARRRLAKQENIAGFIELNAWLEHELITHDLLIKDDLELSVAKLSQFYLAQAEHFAQEIESLIQWCIRAMTDSQGQVFVKDWLSFHIPKRLDYQRLVDIEPVGGEDKVGRLQAPPSSYRHRDGFKLTDNRMSPRQVYNEIDYCVYCHDKEGDFCSKGFPVKKGEEDKGLKVSPLDEILTGCPLEEKISEMHVLKRDGYTLGALAMIMIDNPMCPATGHRICNDCMKACIYQKQEPVNIPQTETGILTDVLSLPWGVEIYDLFTRWNPLRQTQWVAKPYNGAKVLIMGMGPAGFTLAHHLLMEGCAVVGTDGLKIEPLPESLLNQPIYRYSDIKEELDDRVMAGFGGVAEYGITVRWDKNFLKLIYISLMRRPYFQVYGGVRFGGTLLIEDAWRIGFDHMAIAVGAGLPKELAIPGSLAPGMRQANDFLMALQLTGAAKNSSLANLQVRLPAVVIGGGLTGIDTATEVQAYYIAQVEKVLVRYETLSNVLGEARLREQFSEPNFAILNEFLVHGRIVREERQRAIEENRLPDLLKLIRQWGGVTVAYRGLLSDSPAYKRNNEEVSKAFEEGIYYAEGLAPKVVRLDQYGHVEALVSESRVLDEKGQWITTDEEHVLPARAIFVATGARPNIAYEFEHRGSFHREGTEYKAYDIHGKLVEVAANSHSKITEFGAFTSYQRDNHRVTFLGDTHPVFHGSVVKAISSAKRIYPAVMQALGERQQSDEQEYLAFAQKMKVEFSAVIKAVKRHTPSVIELTIYAPMAVRNYQPGQFYRLQNYERLAKQVGDTKLQTEAIAMLGAGVDKEKGLLSLMIIEGGASSRLFATLKPGDAIAIMGPTGVRTKIPPKPETIMIVGGRLSAAYVRAVGPAMRAAGHRVLYIAGLQTADEIHCQTELQEATDKIVWITQTGLPVATKRSQDRAATGDFVGTLLQYATGNLDSPMQVDLPLQEINHIMVVGTHKLLRLIQDARKTVLKEHFSNDAVITGSVYGPMQCMLKGVCAQCLIWQIDPQTGKRTKAVFTCSWQDQPLDMVDLDNLEDRLAQNRMQETLSNLWLDYLFNHYEIPRI
jgi:NADPH-dependent glutamate synthase beta subunit-like oxidoreductase/NAD(P)H-flavin reductase